MFTLEGRSIGDAWYYAAGDAVHVYFLTKPDGSEAGLDIGHAVSRVLVDWVFLGLALERGPQGSWDEALSSSPEIPPLFHPLGATP